MRVREEGEIVALDFCKHMLGLLSQQLAALRSPPHFSKKKKIIFFLLKETHFSSLFCNYIYIYIYKTHSGGGVCDVIYSGIDAIHSGVKKSKCSPCCDGSEGGVGGWW